MKVKEVMHDGVTWVSPQTPILELAKKMQTDDVGSIPVGENDRLVGMVTDRDIVCRGLAGGKDPSKIGELLAASRRLVEELLTTS